MTLDAFSKDYEQFYKICFIDDMTANIRNNDSRITKLYSEGRHNAIDLI